jgi:hypothetical protein
MRFLMGWLSRLFGTTEPPTPAVLPQPTIEQQLRDREAELLSEIHAADADLGRLREETRTFRAQNFAFLGGQMFLRRERLKERGAIERDSERLRQREMRLVQRRSAALLEWARLKAAREATQ